MATWLGFSFLQSGKFGTRWWFLKEFLNLNPELGRGSNFDEHFFRWVETTNYKENSWMFFFQNHLLEVNRAWATNCTWIFQGPFALVPSRKTPLKLDLRLLMEDIPNNHLGCIKPCQSWDIYYINWLISRISEPSTVCIPGFFVPSTPTKLPGRGSSDDPICRHGVFCYPLGWAKLGGVTSTWTSWAYAIYIYI